MFLGTLSFLSPFSILQSGCADLHAQNIHCESRRRCRKTTPLYSTIYKPQGNRWIEEIIRPVHCRILRTGTRKNSLVYPYKSVSSGNFWENLTGTFLRDANPRPRCCEMPLFCFMSVIYAQQQK